MTGSDDLRYHGTELVLLYDYKAQGKLLLVNLKRVRERCDRNLILSAPDDLSVKRGDWIYADLNNQTVDGWLW